MEIVFIIFEATTIVGVGILVDFVAKGDLVVAVVMTSIVVLWVAGPRFLVFQVIVDVGEIVAKDLWDEIVELATGRGDYLAGCKRSWNEES